MDNTIETPHGLQSHERRVVGEKVALAEKFNKLRKFIGERSTEVNEMDLLRGA